MLPLTSACCSVPQESKVSNIFENIRIRPPSNLILGKVTGFTQTFRERNRVKLTFLELSNDTLYVKLDLINLHKITIKFSLQFLSVFFNQVQIISKLRSVHSILFCTPSIACFTSLVEALSSFLCFVWKSMS